MSSTVVPCPGRRGSSTAKPAAANACASPRIDCGLPVKPWTTSAPRGPPVAEKGSAPARTAGSAVSVIGIFLAIGVLPPVLGCGGGLGVLVDAVDGTHGQALAAARAQLGDDDDVHPVVEDGAELGRAVAQTGIAVDALGHLDAQCGQLPLRVPL